jgi:hypothetical protein
MSPAAKRSIRTVLQTTVALAAVLPTLAAVLANTHGVTDVLPWLVGGLATAAGAAGGLARFMALPSVEALLDRFGLGLLDDEPGEGPQ